MLATLIKLVSILWGDPVGEGGCWGIMLQSDCKGARGRWKRLRSE